MNKYFSDYFSNYDIAFYYLDEKSQCLNKTSEESFDEIKKEYLIQNRSKFKIFNSQDFANELANSFKKMLN